MARAHIDALARALHDLSVSSGTTRGADGFFHPESEDELVALVKRARRESLLLRVRGSAHSLGAAIYADGTRDDKPTGPHVDVMLDRYYAVRFDDAKMRVTACAGCHLGVDPRDPTGTSTRERSLCAQLEARGWALPDLGGITHQTVSGFLMTGSTGGSVKHSIEASVVGLRIIDGTGKVHDLARDRDELFDAALCSMGLLGVVSEITFQCLPRYDLWIREDVEKERAASYELFGDGEVGLEGFLRSAEYARLMWWPQRDVESVVTWQARRMRAEDYDDRTGPRDAFRPKPYVALGESIKNPTLAHAVNLASQKAGGFFYDALATAARAFEPLAERSPFLERAGGGVRDAFSKRVLPKVLSAFVSVGNTREFWDTWSDGLPMDNQMSDEAMPTEFTEIWVPLERAGEAMRAMREHYDRGGYAATGAYICEIYAARATRGWMHPSYGRDSLRIDLFWFGRNPGDPSATWFIQFWELLKPFGYRLHWGKYLPKTPELGAHYLRAQTPRWNDFLAARRRLDPSDVFLTRYWRDALDI